jgi:hypothetical protein
VTFGYLEAVYLTLKEDANLSGLVDGHIEKFKGQEESDIILRSSSNQSLISVEVQDWAADARKMEPIFLIDIRSRKGAEQALAIADRVKELLKNGVSRDIEGVSYAFKTLELEGKPRWDKKLAAWRIPYVLRGFIGAALSISCLAPSLASPQKYGETIKFVCISPQAAEDIEYRFLLCGPRTGGQWADITGWKRTNHWTWTTERADVGANSVKVEVRHARLGKLDTPVSATANFAINDNSAPVISSLICNPASPYRKNSSILWICQAIDDDGDNIQFRFWLSGARNLNSWQDMTGWQILNHWTWGTTDKDVGVNNVKVQVRDMKHAGAGGFDDEKAVSFEVTVA